MAKLAVDSKLPDGTIRTARGQEARTLLLLIEKGVVAYDFRGGPPFRLPAYTCLQHNHGLVIETRHENHDGGRHGRFVLNTPVEIVAVRDPASRPALEAVA